MSCSWSRAFRYTRQGLHRERDASATVHIWPRTQIRLVRDHLKSIFSVPLPNWPLAEWQSLNADVVMENLIGDELWTRRARAGQHSAKTALHLYVEGGC